MSTENNQLTGNESTIELFAIWEKTGAAYEAALQTASSAAVLRNTIRAKLIGKNVTLEVTRDPLHEVAGPAPPAAAAAPALPVLTEPAHAVLPNVTAVLPPPPPATAPPRTVPFHNALVDASGVPLHQVADEDRPLPDAARLASMAQPRDTADMVLGQYQRGTYNFDRAATDSSGRLAVHTEHGEQSVQLAKRVPLPERTVDDEVTQLRANAGVQGSGLDAGIQQLAQQELGNAIRRWNLYPPGARQFYR